MSDTHALKLKIGSDIEPKFLKIMNASLINLYDLTIFYLYKIDIKTKI